MAVNHGIQNLATLVQGIQAQGQDLTKPIVLISGFSGWGEAIFGTINYWGGFGDIPTALLQAGYTVIAVRIGPFSSNWERACEVYRQLSSGVFDTPATFPATPISVDYGPVYPPRYGYNRNGTTKRAVLYGALPAGWTWDTANPVHFICHSQGGNTIRMLIELMSGRHQDLHPDYFPGVDRQSWVRSVVTIGTPHKGTTVTDVVRQILPPNPIELISRLVASTSFRTPRFYDLQLDHWGFSRLPGEAFQAMFLRIQGIVAQWWQGPQPQQGQQIHAHNGFYDNSIDGVNLLNAFAPNPSPDTAYFTMSFDATTRFPHINPTPRNFRTFPINPFLSPIYWLTNPGGFPFSFGAWVYSKIPFSPTSIDYARWFVQVANGHLGQLGYFNRVPLPGARVPRPDVLPLMMLPAFAMGGYTIPNRPKQTSAEFQPNDGIVNTVSMRGPDDQHVFDVANFQANNRNGRYWHIGVNETIDHADQIGVFTNPETYQEVERMYLLFAQLVTRM